MANDKIDMSAFVKDIRDRQALDINEPVKDVPETKVKNEPIPSKMGRPKKNRKIEDGAPMSVIFDQETKKKMVMTKHAHKIEMKDLIVGATILFLDKHYENGELSAKGIKSLEKVLDRLYGDE